MVNERDKVRTLSLCFDTMLNNYLSKKFKLIKINLFNYLIKKKVIQPPLCPPQTKEKVNLLVFINFCMIFKN
jgi:hypothetical protein